jgi:DNA-binding transcriptional LysR family regulator
MLYLFRQFLALADAHSYIKASEILHISQPALSKNIRKLEEYYNCQLIERSRHGCSLTEYGSILYNHAVHIEQELRQLETELERTRKRTQGRLTVGFGLLWQMIYATDIFLSLKRKQSEEISIISKNGSCEDMTVELLNGTCDLYLGKLPEEKDNRLVTIPILQTRNAVFAHRSHPSVRSDGSPVPLEELYESQWAVLGSMEDLLLCDIPSNLKHHLENRTLGFISSIHIMLGILQKGEDLIILPRHVGERFAAFDIVEVKVSGVPFTPFISGLTYRREMEQNRYLQQLVSMIQELLHAQPPS